MSQPRAPEPDKKRGVERFLGVFTDMRAGEARVALLLTTIIFLVLTSYYIIKVLRESFLLSEPGGELFKSLTAGGLAIVSVGVVKAYDALYKRFERGRLLTLIFLAFTVGLALFFVLYSTAGPSIGAGIAFFLFVGTYGAFIIAVFWSLANDVYTEEQGKRLFPLIGVGSTIGGVVGAYVPKPIMKALGVEGPLLIAAALLLVAMLLARVVNASRDPSATPAPADDADLVEGVKAKERGGFSLVMSNRYLLLLALLILVLNWVNSIGEYILAATVKESAVEALAAAGEVADPRAFIGQWIGGFYSDFYVVVNVAVVAIQALVVSRFLKVFGVRMALFVLPCVALTGYAAMAIIPVLGVMRASKTAENSTDYSLQNTAQQALFLVTTRAEKYKAKAVIDTFFKRGGDVLHAVVVYIGTRPAVGLSIRGFIVINLVLTVIWLAIVTLLTREHRRITRARAEAEEAQK